MINLSLLYLTKQIFFLHLRDEFFYNNLGIGALITYFCFVLIDLINDYKNHKNVCCRNNNVYLGVCMMVFMRIVSIKRGYVMCIVTFKIIFSMKSDIRNVWGWGKMCENCVCAF